MCTLKRIFTTIGSVLLVLNIGVAQEQAPAGSTRSTITVTAAAAENRVRFIAPNTVVQMRLEVYGVNGQKLFDNEIRGGNVIDWHLQNGHAEPLTDGTYLCVVTIKSLSGKITQMIGSATVEKSIATLQATVASQLTLQQSEAIGPIEDDASLIFLKEGESQTATIVAHNGEDGQVTRGQGALSFRIGDFFRGKDIEQMRLTSEGNLGIGIANPQARLDVAGAIRASQGIIFPDGTIQFSAARKTFGTASQRAGESPDFAQGEEPHPSISGTGTTGQIPKWQNGPSGVLSDSVISELNGSIGINGVPNPTFKLDVTGHNRFRGSNVSFYLTGVKPGGNEWLFQTIDADGRLRIFDSTSGFERLSLTQSGNVGVGITSPNSRLTVGGVIESTSGGIKFPDGTTQTTAATGTGGGLTLPFSGATSSGSTAFAVTNNGSGEGVFGKGRNGVHGQSSSETDSGVWGESLVGGYGVSGSTTTNGQLSVSPAGVWGHNGASGFGVKGTSGGIAVYGAGGTGVYGAGNSVGVSGISTNGFAIAGSTTNGTGVYGDNGNSNTAGHAGYFNGRVSITGNLTANNLAGAKTSQEHSGAGFTQLGNSVHEVDRVTIDVPASGVLFMSAFINVRVATSNRFDLDFLISRVLPTNQEVPLVLVKHGELCDPFSGDTVCRNVINLSWILPVSEAGTITLKTSTMNFSSQFLMHEGDHNLSVVYLPKQY